MIYRKFVFEDTNEQYLIHKIIHQFHIKSEKLFSKEFVLFLNSSLKIAFRSHIKSIDLP